MIKILLCNDINHPFGKLINRTTYKEDYSKMLDSIESLSPISVRIANAKFVSDKAERMEFKEAISSGKIAEISHNNYIITNTGSTTFGGFTIDEVDTSRPWSIAVENGSEVIKYFKQEDPLYNFYRAE
jgi:CRISPR/Cas system-associated endonuclease Cas1